MQNYKDYLKKTLSAKMRAYRTLEKMKQEKMAEELRISTRCYSDLERGKSFFSGMSLLFFLILLPDEEIIKIMESLRALVEKEKKDAAA